MGDEVKQTGGKDEVGTAPASLHVEDANEGTRDMSNELTKINFELKEKAVEEYGKNHGLTYVNLLETPINPDMFGLLTEEEMRSTPCLPFFRLGKKVRVAIASADSPETLKIVEVLKEKGYIPHLAIASDTTILSTIENFFSKQKKIDVEIHNNDVDEAKLLAYEKEIENLALLGKKLSTMSTEEAVNVLCISAIKTHASDMHFQPEEKTCKLRFRIDGMMQAILDIDLKTYSNIANQIKYKSKLKLNITNEPQDGRFFFLVNSEKVDVRVSVLPTEYGETLALRMLDARSGFLSLQQLGFNDYHYAILQKVTALPHGLVLVTGPTGSGKTTTLYALLDQMNVPTVKIITLEDPIEYHLNGITQSQINEKRGYTFSNGLKAILRQNPNIVMIGEIRDFDTAHTTCEAALTGHIALSTLHTNGAVETITRMLNIGVAEFLLSPALEAIISQRLVRVLCSCSMQTPPTQNELLTLTKHLDSITKKMPDLKLTSPKNISRIKGCDACSHTGYKGQTQVAEILLIDQDIREAILNKKSEPDLIKLVESKGMLTMIEDGIIKILQGKTTLEEVYRVCMNHK